MLTLTEFRQATAHLDGDTMLHLPTAHIGLVWQGYSSHHKRGFVCLDDPSGAAETVGQLEDRDILYFDDSKANVTLQKRDLDAELAAKQAEVEEIAAAIRASRQHRERTRHTGRKPADVTELFGIGDDIPDIPF